MAAIGTTVTRQAPYPAQSQEYGRACYTLTGAGVDTTVIAASVLSSQLHVVGGFLSVSAAATIQVLSGTSIIGILPFPAAGVLPFPSVYTSAGEALSIDNADAATVFAYVEVEGVDIGSPAPAAE